jgi:hypothetical protein
MKKTLFAVAILGAAMTSPAFATPPINPGNYLCKAGGSRMMLTLGNMQVSGMSYTFKEPTGQTNTGTYSITPTGYKWNGAIGAIQPSQIAESKPDGTPGEFWFSFHVSPQDIPTSVSCAPV